MTFIGVLDGQLRATRRTCSTRRTLPTYFFAASASSSSFFARMTSGSALASSPSTGAATSTSARGGATTQIVSSAILENLDARGQRQVANVDRLVQIEVVTSTSM